MEALIIFMDEQRIPSSINEDDIVTLHVNCNTLHGSHSKQSLCNSGDLGSIPRLGRYPGEGNGYPLQYSCLENSKDRGAWWATRLSD